MRGITKEACFALKAKRNWRKSNTSVEVQDGVACLYLHGNLIAIYDEDDQLSISNAGWESHTTKERLNGVLRTFNTKRGIYQEDWTWYIQAGSVESREEFPCNEFVNIPLP